MMNHRCAALFFGLVIACIDGPASWSQDLEYQAISAAAKSVAATVVQIETIGASTGSAEITQGTPVSGTIVDPDGYIVTCLWGLEQTPASILVVFADGTRLPAQLIARDFNRELVLLKVDPPEPLQFIPLSTSVNPTVGQWAISIGRGISPDHPSISVGIVSATKRMHGRAIQIDARVSPPFYGGPVVDIQGSVLGFSVPMKPDAGSTTEKADWYDSGIAFVIPCHAVLQRLEKLKAGDNIKAGKLGVVPSSKMPFAQDTTLSTVLALSPAKRAGIKAGDKLISIDGHPVRWIADIKQLLGPRDAGEIVIVKIRRDEQDVELEVTLVGDIPPFRPGVLGVLPRIENDRILVDHVFPNSPAETAKLIAGDAITHIDGQPINDIDQLRLRVMTHPIAEEFVITIERAGQPQTAKCGLELTPATIAANLPTLEPLWMSDEWTVSDRSLPDVSNKAHLLHPDAPDTPPLSLLVLLSRPGSGTVEDLLSPWKETAAIHNLAVLVIGASDAKRWKPSESDIIIRLIQQAQKTYQISEQRVAVGGFGAGAEMALMVTMRNREVFRGVVSQAGTRPGGFSLLENDPANPVQVLVAGGDEIPIWGRVIAKAGFPVMLQRSMKSKPLIEDASVRNAIARWIRSLDRI